MNPKWHHTQLCLRPQSWFVDTVDGAVDEGQPVRLSDSADRRLAALDEFLSAYEAEHGEITDQDLADAVRQARARAVVMRGRQNSPNCSPVWTSRLSTTPWDAATACCSRAAARSTPPTLASCA
jgi:hypothetical protein